MSFFETLNKTSKVIALDFDGVIHNDNKGFHDGTVYGEPIEGAIEAIKQLAEKYILIIYSCKSNPNRPLIDNKNGTELIKEWLEKHNISYYIKDIVWGKPNAFIYIDDKGYHFTNWEDILNFIK